MAWTSPRTWVTGETVTASLLNTHVRDNLLETAPAKVTTAGDIVYGTAANAVARLGIGGANTVLHGGASAPSYSPVATADIAADAATHTATNGISGTSTASGSLADITGSSFSFTGAGGTAYAVISLLGLSNLSLCVVNLNWNVDGSDLTSVLLNETVAAGSVETKTYVISIGAVSGAHTYKLRWSTSAGTLSIGAGQIQVFEFRR